MVGKTIRLPHPTVTRMMVTNSSVKSIFGTIYQKEKGEKRQQIRIQPNRLHQVLKDGMLQLFFCFFLNSKN